MSAHTLAERLLEPAPLLGPLAVIESQVSRAMPTVAFTHAKVVHVMSGGISVSTPSSCRLLLPGDAMVLGSSVPCAAVPAPEARMWTIYLDEEFLRRYMLWALPHPTRLRPELSPDGWDGQDLFVHIGTETQARLEPLLRQMSVLPGSSDAAAAAMMMALFAKTVELSVPPLLVRPDRAHPLHSAGMAKRLTARPPSPEAMRAVALLGRDLARAWTSADLARAVSLSRSQLTRQFARDFGVSPMRWLAEARTTEFARLIDETSLPVGIASRQVGWADRRVAAARFRRRYGVSPSQFRR